MKFFFEENKLSEKPIPTFLIGNKSDLQRKVPENSTKKLLKNNHCLKYMSVSAKNDDSKIISLFQELGEQIYENKKGIEKKNQQNITLKKGETKKKKQCIFIRCLV